MLKSFYLVKPLQDIFMSGSGRCVNCAEREIECVFLLCPLKNMEVIPEGSAHRNLGGCFLEHF